MLKASFISAVALSLLPACVEMGDGDDPELSQEELGLTGANYMTFTTGYGEGYLSPIPDSRTGVAYGMVGWISTETTTVFPGIEIRVPAFKTKSSNGSHYGYAHLKYRGTVPATGTCTLNSPAILVEGSTHVEGKNPFPYTGGTDGSASSTLFARAWVNGSFSYYQYWNVASDSTKSEVRTKSFDKAYYLQSGPTFYATGGSTVELDIELDNNAWANADGDASLSIYQFGMLANSNPNLISIQCY